MKKFNAVRKYGSRLALAAAAFGSAAAHAAVTTIDTTEPVAQVAEGATAAVAIGLAMLGFCVLIGVIIKTRRSGS